jgi:hypothetical protein
VNVTQAIRELQKIEANGGGNLIIGDEYAEDEIIGFEKSTYEDGRDVTHDYITYRTAEILEDEEDDLDDEDEDSDE